MSRAQDCALDASSQRNTIDIRGDGGVMDSAAASVEHEAQIKRSLHNSSSVEKPTKTHDLASTSYRIPNCAEREDIRTHQPRRSTGHGMQQLPVCRADILFMNSHSGWRESGAYVELSLNSMKKWVIKVFRKDNRMLQYIPDTEVAAVGYRNKANHAMLWKGGVNWILEFRDTEWSAFQDIHKGCCDLNDLPAKEIPTSGWKLATTE